MKIEGIMVCVDNCWKMGSRTERVRESNGRGWKGKVKNTHSGDTSRDPFEQWLRN
jgi:hypothetical protein